MPTYEYTCTECGEQVEVVQKFTDDPLTVCTACGGRLRKVFSPVGIVFKGSGFYRTDSRNASNGDGRDKNGDGRDKKDKEPSGAKPDSKSGSSADSGSSGSGSSGSSDSSSSSKSSSSSDSGSSSSGSGSSGSSSSGSSSGSGDKKGTKSSASAASS